MIIPIDYIPPTAVNVWRYWYEMDLVHLLNILGFKKWLCLLVGPLGQLCCCIASKTQNRAKLKVSNRSQLKCVHMQTHNSATNWIFHIGKNIVTFLSPGGLRPTQGVSNLQQWNTKLQKIEVAKTHLAGVATLPDGGTLLVASTTMVTRAPANKIVTRAPGREYWQGLLPKNSD